MKRNEVFCAYCRYAHSHGLITFARRGDQTTFSATGFDNYKKAIEKFNHHAHSSVHQEAVMKCSAMSQPSIESQLSSQFRKQQQLHREGLIKQLTAMKFLLRQGLAIRGRHEKDKNLYQLLLTWAKDSESVADWLKQGRFLAHDHINELVSLMGQDVLRKVLARMKSSEPSWFSIIADEATDIVYQ